MTPARLLYAAAGQPDPRKPQHAHAECITCFVCGLRWPGPSCRVVDVCSTTYTDEDISRARWSDWVCTPCAWAMTGRPPDTLRNWSVVYRTDRPQVQTNDKAQSFPPACLTTRADSRPIVDALLSPPSDGSPWFVAVAESGQIHTAPFAPMNAGSDAWGVRFERRTVRSSPAEFGAVLHHVATLLCAGYVRDDVLGLEPHPSKLAKYGPATWRAHAEPLRRYLTSGLLEFAVFLCTREFQDEYRARTSA